MKTPSMLMKTKWYPQPHDSIHSWAWKPYTATVDSSILYPLIRYDEIPTAGENVSTHYTNPENAGFVENNFPNCWPESRINSIDCLITFTGSKLGLQTQVPINFGVMVVSIAFKENHIVIDELSTLEIQDVLELQTESTDRQSYPLYNGTKVTEKFTNSTLMATVEPGLTASQKLEYVDFDIDAYYDMLQYGTISGKLKNVQSGLKWYSIDSNHRYQKIRITQKPNTKRMNEYTQLAVLMTVPPVNTHYQQIASGDVTTIEDNLIYTTIQTRFLEWNENFNFERV